MTENSNRQIMAPFATPSHQEQGYQARGHTDQRRYSRRLHLNYSRLWHAKMLYSCDLCRVRKVTCIKEVDAASCALCQRRNVTCTFRSQPLRKNKGPNTSNDETRPLHQLASFRDLRISFAKLDQPLQPSLDALRGIQPSMMIPGHTCFYSGSSGDQGPDLLRHLSFNEDNVFGGTSWAAWRVLPRVDNPVYFTVSTGFEL
jgi:Fungal Zn(2)-Cys(6) binuclear cluster domain